VARYLQGGVPLAVFMLTQERLKELFDYQSTLGRLLWKVRKRANVRIGEIAGSKRNRLGYRAIGIDGVYFEEHRLIWSFHNGDIPKNGEIDHIDHVPSNNRIQNLRLTTRAGNCLNKSFQKNNTSGRIGVYADRGNWRAMIGFQGKLIHLGNFSNKQDAVKARKEAERIYGFHSNHGMKAAA
jgi:hypothetical protein